ncbi:MAG: lamin tail domain-containing protein [Phycisphaerae bacterium]|nr:lamin tail domain-containing protein [Phycisphaerae bacterium]
MSSKGLSGPAVVINEVMASNRTTLADPQGQFDDWIELYNAGDTVVNVGGMYLTDDPVVPRKWRIPAGLPGLRSGMAISPKGYLIIWADGDILDAGLHANFKLGAGGEEVRLFAADGVTPIDSLEFGQQTPDVSYGRYPDGGQTLRFFGVPTPGRANSEGYLGEVTPLRFSHERGFYGNPFDVTITTATEGARILYTLDGYAPNEARPTPPARDRTERRPGGPDPGPAATDPGASLYGGPIRIGKTTCLRVRADKPGWKPTPVYTHTYIFDPRPELLTLPVVALVGGPGTVFYEPNGVMAIVGGTYPGGVWASSGTGSYDNMLDRELERPVSAEWLYAGDDEGFQADCGLRVHGSSYMRPRYVRQNGLWSGSGKISLRLYFRGEYGQSRLEYPLIPMSEAGELATVILRAGHNDPVNPFIKDELLRRLHKDMGQAACTGTFANLFIDGEYKGFYNPTEQVTEESCQQWFDSDRSWDVIAMFNEVRDGDSTSFDTMVSYASTHDMANPLYYAELQKKLDLVSFIDYLIIRLWPNDWDWPQNNWSAACERSETGQWKFFVWDAEGTFESGQLSLDRFNELNIQGNANGYLYQALKRSPDFRQLFADRVYKHFYNGGALTDGNIQKRFFELRDALQSVIPNMYRDIIDTWTPNRRSIFLNACVREGMYTFAGPDFAVNDVSQYGGQVTSGDRLSMTATDGRGLIYYTLDGTDPAQSASQWASTILSLVTRDAPKRVLVPAEPPANDWRTVEGVDDSSWLSFSGRPGGIGFGRGSGFESYVSANVNSRMYNVNGSCYIRIPFRFDGDAGTLGDLVLAIQYDDGFIAYLNGTEVARRNFVGDPAWNSTATVSRDNAEAVVFEPIYISDQIGMLRQGDNVLAIQGLNASANNSDFLIGVELTASREPSGAGPAGLQRYTGPISLTRTTLVKACVASGSAQSALAEAVFAVGPVKENLRISEIMYHPADTGTPGDPNTEYIELTNIGAEAINLGFVQFTKGIRFTFPDMELAPHAFCVVVKDRAAFAARYGQGLPVAGQYAGSLDDKGEQIELRDAAGAVIHSFRYRDNWFRSTDGSGYSLTIQHPASTPATAWNTSVAWRPSVAPGGSPGSDDSGAIPEAGAVVINELLANPAGGGHDWVELYNTTAQAIDLGGWFLSDNADNLTKYEIAPGTILAPHAYLVFTEDLHFSNLNDRGCHEPFGFSRSGESAYLCSGAGGRITGYREHAKFGASETGVAFGRYVDGVGGVHFVPLRKPTPGAANASPPVGPVVISEILYHADGSGDVEYVELQNASDAEVTLYDPVRGSPWRFTGTSDQGDIELLLPQDPPITLGPRNYLVLAKDRVLFLSRFSVLASIQVLEWRVGSLSDAGASVELSRPGDPDNDVRTWIGVDRVTYSDGSHPEDFPAGLDPWPVQADGQGQSLVRITVDTWGDDPLNWQASAPSPGAARQRPNR